MNGQPLLPQHGAPVRLIVPGWYGMTHVKWLPRITRDRRAVRRATSTRSAYRLRPGRRRARHRRSIRIEPRALMVPPGFPDFMTPGAGPRRRAVHLLRAEPGPGWAPIDGGRGQHRRRASWQDAELRLNGARRARLALLDLPVLEATPGPRSSRVGHTDAACPQPDAESTRAGTNNGVTGAAASSAELPARDEVHELGRADDLLDDLTAADRARTPSRCPGQRQGVGLVDVGGHLASCRAPCRRPGPPA